MLTKIHLIMVAVFVILMAVLTYLAFDWLGSLTAPADIVTNFEWYMGIGRKFLWFSTLILLVFANIILWKDRKSLAFWATFLYFALFILIQSFWLDRAFMQFQNDKGLTESTLSISPFIGVLLLIALFGFVYFNQFFVNRMRDRMFDKETPIQDLSEEENENIPENPKSET